MLQTDSVQGLTTGKEAREQIKQQLAQYVQQQPASTQAIHRLMKILELVSLVIIAAAFILAMVVSINWTAVQKAFIPIAWFIFAASASPTMVLLGLHSVLLRAIPPTAISGSMRKLITGRGASWAGLALVLLGLALAAFWGYFAYAVWTFNMDLLEPLIGFLGAVMGIGMTVSIVFAMLQKLIKTR